MTLLMRTVVITVHNDQRLEVFVEKRKDGFELWIVSLIKGRRVVLDHHLTHDDLEARLEYARTGDLVWMDASRSQIPSEIHPVAEEAAEAIKRGVFADFETELQQPLAYHITGIINVLPLDGKEWNAAKKAILGRWTDGVATVVFEPDSKLFWSCPLDQSHPLNSGARVRGHKPDWWSFASWQLHLMNDEHKTGMRIAVLRVDDRELHICNLTHPHRLADVFHRDRD